MNTRTLCQFLIPFTLGLTLASAEEIDIEARKQSIAIIEKRLAGREDQMTEIANDIIRLHRRVDGKLEGIVKRLANIKDSTKSGFRVSKLKMEAIEGLKKSVEDYQSRRAGVIREIREGRTGIPKEVLEGEADHFDEHIEKHIKQILTLSKSFTQDENVEKYKKVGGGGYDYDGWGWDDHIYEISDEWYQNRRDRIMNKKQRTEVTDALNKSVERCESLVVGLRNNLDNHKLTPSDRELMTAELNRHLRMKETREGQLYELLLVDKPHTDSVSRDSARELEAALRDHTADLRRDMETIFFKHAQLNRERSKFYELEANLAARKKWLAEHEKEADEEGAIK